MIELAGAKRRIKQLETELAVSREVNEVFLEGDLPPKRLFPAIESLTGEEINGGSWVAREAGVGSDGSYSVPDCSVPPIRRRSRDAGYHVVGGGVLSSSESPGEDVNSSYPSKRGSFEPGNDGWSGFVDNTTGSAEVAQAFAICAKAGKVTGP